MTDLSNHDELLAPEYALGLLRGELGSDVAARLAHDESLRSLIEYWQQVFTALEPTAPAAEPAPDLGLFDKILNRIDAAGLQLPGTVTKRGHGAAWREIAPGIHSRVLYVDRPNNRISVLVRMDPGAVYYSHEHDVPEETLVLEGDLELGDLRLAAGDHHLATPEARHPVGRTVSGCLVHVMTSLSHAA